MKYASFAILLCLGFAACKSDPTAPNEPPIAAPTSIAVQSIDTTSILVSWSRASGDTKADTVVIAAKDGSFAKVQAANKPDSTAIIRGLQTGVPYTISVHSANNSSPSVVWTIAGAPTNIAVLNVDTSKIIVAWHRATGDTKADTIVISWQGVTVKSQAVSAPDTAALVAGLSPGVPYVISIHTANTVSSSVSWTIPVPPPPPAFASAHVGSSFLYREWSVDSLGRRTVVDTFRYTVVALDISALGKTHVTQFMFAPYNTDPFFVNYEPNGDIEIYESNGSGGGTWLPIPLTSKGQTTTVTKDTVENGSSHVTTETYTYAGTEDITVGTQTFRNTVKILGKTTNLENGLDQNPQPVTTIWFSPDLGWYIKASTPAYSAYGSTSDGFDEELTSYILK
jgi:hypothetical protein